MNTGQSMLSLGALILFSFLSVNFNSTILENTTVETENKVYLTAFSLADDLIEDIKAAEGDFATPALNAGLIEGLKSRTEIRDMLTGIVGEDKDEPGSFNAVGMSAYLAQMRMMAGSTVEDENVAVITAVGEIGFGVQPPGAIGGDSTAALLREARSSLERTRSLVDRQLASPSELDKAVGGLHGDLGSGVEEDIGALFLYHELENTGNIDSGHSARSPQ